MGVLLLRINYSKWLRTCSPDLESAVVGVRNNSPEPAGPTQYSISYVLYLSSSSTKQHLTPLLSYQES